MHNVYASDWRLFGNRREISGCAESSNVGFVYTNVALLSDFFTVALPPSFCECGGVVTKLRV